MSAAVRSHGANVLRALAHNLEPEEDAARLAPPLDHPTARDAVTFLGWHGECTSDQLQEALDLSQPACVRVVDRLVAAGLATRRRTPGERRLGIALTAAGERAGDALADRARTGVEQLLDEALPDPDELARFVAALDRVVTAAFGSATDTVRFCRSCDASACLAGPRGCPSDQACRANLAAREP